MQIQNTGHYDQTDIERINQEIKRSFDNYGQIVFADIFERLCYRVLPVSITVDIGKKTYVSKIEEYVIFPGVGYRKSLILDDQVNRPHTVEYFTVLDGSTITDEAVSEFFI